MEDGGGLLALGVEGAGLDRVALFHSDLHVPFLGEVQGGDVDPSAQEGAGDGLQALQGAGNAVEDVAQQAGAQHQGHGGPGGGDRLAGGQSGGVLIHLHGGHIPFHAHHFTDELLVAGKHHVHHGQAFAAYHLYHRAVDTVNAIFTHSTSPSLHLVQVIGQGQPEGLGEVAGQLVQPVVEGAVHPQP